MKNEVLFAEKTCPGFRINNLVCFFKTYGEMNFVNDMELKYKIFEGEEKVETIRSQFYFSNFSQLYFVAQKQISQRIFLLRLFFLNNRHRKIQEKEIYYGD